MADPFLDGKPMTLSKNGSDNLCDLLLFFAFHERERERGGGRQTYRHL